MKLTSELIFDRLSEQYDVRYTISNEVNTIVSRPIFYEYGQDVGDHICILSPRNPIFDYLDSGVFITVGELLPNFSVKNIELLTVPRDVSVTQLFNSLQQIFDYYDEWENELNKIIEEDKGYAALIECTTKFIDTPLSLVDEDFTVIAISGQEAEGYRDSINTNKVSTTIMNELISEPQFSEGLHKDAVFEFNVGGGLFLSYNFKNNSRYLGRVSLYFKDKKSKAAYIYLLYFLAQKIDIMLKRYGSFLVKHESTSSLREILIGYLNNNPLESQYVMFRLNENGWSLSDSYILLRLQPEFRHEWQLHASYLIPLVERLWPGASAVEHDDYVVVLLNLDIYRAKNTKDFMQELAYFLRDGLMLAGLCRPFSGLDKISSYYKQTGLSILLGRDIAPMNWYYCFDDYALLCLLSYGTHGFTPEQICSKVVLELTEYDKENNTELYKTLQTFYNKKFSYTHAAEALYIHRTTLIKRVERIIELTNVNLDDADGNLYIQLSFKFLDKTREVPGLRKQKNPPKALDS